MADVMQLIRGGFFDSVNQDRLYSASDMTMPYKRIVSDGVFPDRNGSASQDFIVSYVEGMLLSVAPGNALLGGRWAESLEALDITVAGNSSAYDRIDSIILRADASRNVRAIGIVYRQGEAAASPTAPALESTADVKELRIANIYVASGAASLSSASISDQRGTEDCPWVAGVIPPTQAQIGEAVDEYLDEHPGIFVVDSEFSDSSTNAVQNRVVAAAVGEIRDDVTDINGRLDEQGEIVNRLNEGGLDIKDDVIEAQITDWLNDHPEATTTVRDGAITESKFSASVKKAVDASKIRDLAIDSVAFMNFQKTGYTSLEGVCALDDRHVVVVRYLPNDERSFSVWDISTQSFVVESILTNAQVGHCNTITYAEPYIYVATLSSGNGVVRLLVDSETKEITYDSVVYAESAYPHCVAYHDGHFYCLRKANNTFTLTVTDNFQNFTTLGTSSFDNGAYLTAQGMSVYGDLVFLTFSTSFRYTGTDVTSERIPLLTEAIYVTDKSLNVLKTSFHSRGRWGESEGCDVMVVSGQAYLLVGSNANDVTVSSVHALPIFNDTEQLEVFYGCKVISGVHRNDGAIILYIDSAYDSPFAKGNKSNPFGSIPVALTVARQIDAPVTFNITGTFPALFVRWFKNPIYLNITDSTITAVEITHCNNVYINCSNASFGQMKIESSTVMVPAGPSLEKMDESVTNAVMLYRSFFTGNIKYIGAFNNGLAVYASVVNASVTTNEATRQVNVVTPSLAYVNGAIQ